MTFLELQQELKKRNDCASFYNVMLSWKRKITYWTKFNNNVVINERDNLLIGDKCLTKRNTYVINLKYGKDDSR